MKFRPKQCPNCLNRRTLSGYIVTAENDPANDDNKQYFLCKGKPYQEKHSKMWVTKTLVNKKDVAKNDCHYFKQGI